MDKVCVIFIHFLILFLAHSPFKKHRISWTKKTLFHFRWYWTQCIWALHPTKKNRPRKRITSHCSIHIFSQSNELLVLLDLNRFCANEGCYVRLQLDSQEYSLLDLVQKKYRQLGGCIFVFFDFNSLRSNCSGIVSAYGHYEVFFVWSPSCVVHLLDEVGNGFCWRFKWFLRQLWFIYF